MEEDGTPRAKPAPEEDDSILEERTNSSSYVRMSLSESMASSHRVLISQGALNGLIDKAAPTKLARSVTTKSRSKRESARQEAREISQVLGMAPSESGASPRSTPLKKASKSLHKSRSVKDLSSQVEEGPDSLDDYVPTEWAAPPELSAAYETPAAEAVALRTLVAQMMEDKKQAAIQINSLVRTKKKLAAQAAERYAEIMTLKQEATTKAFNMEQVEREFAEQEALLDGYQRDAEKSMLTIEKQRKRQRQLESLMVVLHGPAWENEYSQYLDDEFVKVSGRLSMVSMDSPVKYSAVAESNTRTFQSSPSKFSPSQLPSIEEVPVLPTSPTPPPIEEAPAPAYPAHLETQLESVKLLVKSLKEELVLRNVRLDELEKSSQSQIERASKLVVSLSVAGPSV